MRTLFSSAHLRGAPSPTVGLLVVMAFWLTLQYWFADFGSQWDEWTMMNPTRAYITKGELLPGNYVYPSFTFILGVLGVIVDVVRYPFLKTDGQTLQQFLEIAVGTGGFHLRSRFFFAVFSSLTMVLVYVTVARWRANRWEALLASTFLALSWEVFYHSAWLVPNTIMMCWVALSTCLSLEILRRENYRGWAALAALAAGFAMGSKYQCGLAIGPIYLALACRLRNDRKWCAFIVTSCIVVFVFTATFLFTTPGILFDTQKMWSDVRQNVILYARNGHGNHTVSTPSIHMWLMSQYFSLALFSWFPLVAGTIAVLYLVGSFNILRGGVVGWIYLSFPIAYILFFGLTQKVMIIRNLMPIAPFLAVAAARGWFILYDRFHGAKPLRYLMNTGLALCLTVNAGWLTWSTWTAVHRRTIDPFALLVEFAGKHRESAIILSPLTASLITKQYPHLPDNLVIERNAPGGLVAGITSEVPWYKWTGNHYSTFVTWFGSYEVNLNYYPSWIPTQYHKIVILPRHEGDRLGLSDPAIPPPPPSAPDQVG